VLLALSLALLLSFNSGGGEATAPVRSSSSSSSSSAGTHNRASSTPSRHSERLEPGAAADNVDLGAIFSALLGGLSGGKPKPIAHVHPAGAKRTTAHQHARAKHAATADALNGANDDTDGDYENENIVTTSGEVVDMEACTLGCTSGRGLQKRPGFEPYSNGCGSYGLSVKSEFGFTPCCDEHDKCYGTCGKTRKACDDAFLACMNQRCQRVPAKQQNACQSEASLFSLSTVALGCNAFINSQREGCECAAHDTQTQSPRPESIAATTTVSHSDL